MTQQAKDLISQQIAVTLQVGRLALKNSESGGRRKWVEPEQEAIEDVFVFALLRSRLNDIVQTSFDENEESLSYRVTQQQETIIKDLMIEPVRNIVTISAQYEEELLGNEASIMDLLATISEM